MNRRRFLLGGASLATLSLVPRAASAGGRDPRLVVIVLRGALDGLSTVVPLGDPGWAALREQVDLADTVAQARAAGLPLDGSFVLNPAMPHLHALYRTGQAGFVHAVATPYRGRSHFDGQDVLESGQPGLVLRSDGWLNRLSQVLASDGSRPHRAVRAEGLAVGAVVPLILQGRAPVTAWAPVRPIPQSPDTVSRILALYDVTQPELHAQFARSLDIRRRVFDDKNGRDEADVLAAAGAGRLLAQPDGPRIAALTYDGWDTHANQGVSRGILFRNLQRLDRSIAALQASLGNAWHDTAVVVVTEFGRTAAENGSDGTDHGTGSLAILAGGMIAGGSVRGDWPGLARSELLDGRDLRPTTDLRAVLKGILRDGFDVPRQALDDTVFPQSAAILPMSDLLRG